MTTFHRLLVAGLALAPAARALPAAAVTADVTPDVTPEAAPAHAAADVGEDTARVVLMAERAPHAVVAFLAGRRSDDASDALRAAWTLARRGGLSDAALADALLTAVARTTR